MGLAIQGFHNDQYSAYRGTLAAQRSGSAIRNEAESGQCAADGARSRPNEAKDGAIKPQKLSPTADSQQLTTEQKADVARLKKRDKEVRAHEQTHVAAGGQYVRGGANYDYATGPDGEKYAVGGEVSIDTNPVPDDPRATIQKMQTIKRAALAPAQPSSQDRTVAATAERTAMQARRELAARALEEQQVFARGNPPTKGTLIAVTV